MLIISIAVAALMTPPAAASSHAAAPSAVSSDHGKLAWFEGSFEDVLAKAKASNKIVFLDFWTSW